ncbi:HD-GYP domain-containing protein [Halobacillus fulvus]|nr:HD-GYP domain-containing protein [Halobacillus fulvus]
MRLIAVNELKPGDTLGKTIFNENGQALLHSGATFTELVIKRLRNYDITYVYVDEPGTEDIEAAYPISEKLRMEAIHSIKGAFRSVKNPKRGRQEYVTQKSRASMIEIVRSLMTELQSHKEVLSLLSDVFTYDDYIFTHSLNVTMYTLALGKQLQLPTRRLEDLGLGAILHDVGKMNVPKEILLKEGKLSREEFETIQHHTEAGFEILRKAPNIPLTAAHCAFQHHERLDGSGYPRGLVSDEIHLYGKILAIADVFDAVTSDRIYRKAMLPHEGLEILYSGAGQLFDKEMVEEFRKCIAIYPNGVTVSLSDGRSGIVVRQNPHLCDRPVIRMFKENGQAVEETYDLDLSKELSVVVAKCDTTSAG